MKQVAMVIAVLASLTLTGAALATPVTVDFSSISYVDITNTTGSPLALDGVITVRYDDFGSGVDSAAVDSVGIFGTTGGSLIFDFSAPATTLTFDYSLLGVSPPTEPVPDGMYIAFFNDGVLVADMLVSGDDLDTFTYSGTEFDRVQMVFSAAGPYFAVGNLSYELAGAPVPEPATVVLLASGLLGLGGRRLLRRKC